MGPNSALRGVLGRVWAAARKRGGGSDPQPGARKTAAKKKTTAKKDETSKKIAKPVKDGQHFIKMEVLKGLGDITEGLIQKAKGGTPTALRLLWELGRMHEDATAKQAKKPPSLGELLTEELRKRNQQRAAPGAGRDTEAAKRK